MGIIEETVTGIGRLDIEKMRLARSRQDRLIKPAGSLGRLEELSVLLAGIQRKAAPVIKDKVIITMAGDHGVTAEGVSLYPAVVTAQMVRSFLKGQAAINVLARTAGARVVVVDTGIASELTPQQGLISHKIGYGTRNMVKGPAMSREEASRAIATGIEVATSEKAKGMDIIGTGDMGIGNTTAAAAITAIMTGHPPDEVTGRGTGIDEVQRRHKITIISRALACNSPDRRDPLGVLAGVGGFEIAGLAGVILAAAASRTPVVIDGFISGAAALIAVGLAPEVKNFLIAGHVSAEPGHKITLQHLGLKPLLDLELRLGEGTGAVLAFFLVEAAARILSEMPTFEEAGISEKIASDGSPA
jgi:nicotinate-nucleotide--dimethylbenzimidazole phosphoribosyltransferase